MAERKGLHPLAWVGIGCAVLVVLGVVAVVGLGMFAKSKIEDFAEQVENRPVETAAKAFALVSPEIAFVAADEESKTATFRNVSTGEEVSVSLADIQQGRVVFSRDGEESTFDVDAEDGLRVRGPDGEAVFGGGGAAKAPEWVPIPPDARTANAFTQTSGGRASGTFGVEGVGSEALLEFYRKALEDAGFTIDESSYSGGGQSVRNLRGSDGEGRTLNVTVPSEGGAVVAYDGPSS
ncbi:MAG TPA: hypothetical protein VMV46_02495 [Thermoanaerobaculia bacterium]|nr:hypothetical protein [Thermoanaerobaculia bacterium]